MRRVRCQALDAHRHDHGDVARVAARGGRLDDCRIEIAAHPDRDLVVDHGPEHVEEVARVEADRDVGAVVVDRELVEAFAALRACAW